MDNKKPLDCTKDFSESELLKYTSEADNLLIFLKTWNKKILKFEFKECVMFQIFNTWNIEDIHQTESSELFKRLEKESMRKFLMTMVINCINF